QEARCRQDAGRHRITPDGNWNRHNLRLEAMKTYFALVGYLALLPLALRAQEACRQAPASVVDRHESFTVFNVSLPSRSGRLTAKALIPNGNRPTGPFVFSLSALVGSEPAVQVQMMSVAIDLATRGR